MHPAIGAGVLQHSNFFEDPTDRVFRSLPRILGAIYDAEPETTGREVRDFHRGIKGVDDAGRTHHALDPETFWWAHATFQFMVEQVVDRFDRHRLTPAERDRLYLEGVEWYRRYGVSDRAVPADRVAFQAEWERVCTDVLEMNDAVRFLLDILNAPRLPKWDTRAGFPEWFLPVADTKLFRRISSVPSRLAAIGGLPPVVRERFDIPWTRRDAAELRLLERTVKTTWWMWPAKIRWQPCALEGWRRAAGRAP